MQKVCAVILLTAIVSNFEALPQAKWSRPIRNSQGQITRERRQFPFGEWIPLSQPCPTCRPFADPLDAGLRGENIGLTPPRPPTVTRQIHGGEGNIFIQDESSILSVPPPPPSAIPRHPVSSNNGNFQFSNFGQQFNAPLAVSTQKIFPQTPQIQFFPQTFSSNQPLLVNGNQQILSGLKAQNNVFGLDQNQQQNTKFNSEFKTQKAPENVVLEQNKRPIATKQSLLNKPLPFILSQQNQQQSFVQQQAFGGQKQRLNFGNSILTPPPAPNNATQNIVIPGLDKEEIQLLYVPVETLRQKGTPQEQLLTQQPQNIQFVNRANGLQRPANTVRPTEQAVVTQPKGHFVTQNGRNQGLKITSTQPFPPSVTTSNLLLHHLPFQQTPQPFVSATPATPTIQPFVTPASVFQKFTPFTPETTLSHLSTGPDNIQFSQSDIEFGTTPKTVSSQEALKEEIIDGKTQLSVLKNTDLNQKLERPSQQSFANQQQVVTQQQQINTGFSQGQQKEILTQSHFPHSIDQQQIALQKQQEHQRLLQEQHQKELEEQQRKQKESEDQRLLQQQQKRQRELEQQRLIQKQKELEEQLFLQQQRQKEIEQQRFLQKQKELEEQRILQERQKELDEQRFLQEQRQKESENQRRLQLQKQKESEEKRRLQLKQKEEEQQLLRLQQQQKELEQQRLLQQQQEEQHLLQQHKLQKQKQENLKKQQQFEFFEQHQQQQQNFPQHIFQQQNRHILPANDNLNFIPQPEKETESEDHLVPHQPPLSVFFKGSNGAEPRITDVLRELRSSGTIIVLDQYFEKMPKVFVGPAGLIPPPGYGKFELPYLSNIENNRIERRIDKLPFFVAPLNFVPPPGYAKIPFPAPHIGSVVVSSESNLAMTLKSAEKGLVEEGSFPVVGPELPGLINNLDTQTTTLKPTNYVSTSSLPQTTAQLRNRRPNSSLYKSQSRKPIIRTRLTTTSKPEDEVIRTIQKTEPTKDSETGFRKPFNRFLGRRRQQAKSTTENPLRGQQDGKSLENRFYSVEVYHQEKNQFPKTQQKSDVITEKKSEENQFNVQFKQNAGSIERITPGGHGVFDVRATPDFSSIFETAEDVEQEEEHSPVSSNADVNLQTYEDGPLPTGSAKTIAQELYRPNVLNQPERNKTLKTLTKPDDIQTPNEFQPENYELISMAKFSEISKASTTDDLLGYKDSVSERQVSVQPTSFVETEKQDGSSERHATTEISRISFTPSPDLASGEGHTPKGLLDSKEQYTSAFAEISKPHHIPGFTDSSKRHQSKSSNAYSSPEISLGLQAPFSQKQHPQKFDDFSEVKPIQNSYELSDNKHTTTASSEKQYLTQYEEEAKSQQPLEISTSQVSPTAPGAIEDQYTTGFFENPQTQNSQNAGEVNRHSEDQRIGSFISVQDIRPNADPPTDPQQYFPSSTPFPSHATPTDIRKNNEYSVVIEPNQPQVLSTPETRAELTVNPSVQTYTSASASESPTYVNEQKPTSEGHGQDVADNFPNDHRLKLPNPSILKVRTRIRGKSRGQVNFAASQSSTPIPFTRSGAENKRNENIEPEFTTEVNHFRDYQALKTSKYNQFRGVKKPVRTTTEATTEYEHKTNVYTIRPQRKPLNPSTVSTKRIRKPTTPIPSAEAATETFILPTIGTYSQSEHSDISPSGVSNDVYYEQSSLSPVKHNLRKHFGTNILAEQKNDFAPAYVSTSYSSIAPTYSTSAQDSYSEDSYVSKDLTQTVAPEDYSEKYPEWNPSESGFDVSGIVLTTTRTPPEHEDQPEFEEPKKSQDSKKAFDPDLEKKAGRRRVRVRVHKRPHENFETAESQNLRTVANVLVPPTTTYKPNDESSIHHLAKNADFSFGGQKLFGLRSRKYFRKHLNLTQLEENTNNKEEEQPAENNQNVDESAEKAKILGSAKKGENAQKSSFNFVSTQSSESGEGNKFIRPKLRGFVRKIVKHGGASKETDSESNQVQENKENEGKHENTEFHPRQLLRLNGPNQTGRVNGTRHKTLVRFVKKNKVRQHEIESLHESNFQELQKEEPNRTTELRTSAPILQPSTTEMSSAEAHGAKEKEKAITQSSLTQSSEQEEIIESKQLETTEKLDVKSTQQQSDQATQLSDFEEEAQASSSQAFQESASETSLSSTPTVHVTGLHPTPRSKFYQTLRPMLQRTAQTGFQKNREPESSTTTTERALQQSKKRNSFTQLKYGKTTSFNSANSEKSEDNKKAGDQQLKSKNFHTLEVRKYLRTKSREGAFSEFSKNKYYTSGKTEAAAPTNNQYNKKEESEEITTERQVETNSSEPKTIQSFVTPTDSLEADNKATENVDNEESESYLSTTEAISSNEEESSEEDVTSLTDIKTTTEFALQTTIFQASSSEAFSPEKVAEPKTATQTIERGETEHTEYQPDIYRFSKNSFSFDETEKFTGTKNRAYVRNITTDIIENTASFSAPGVEKRPDIHVVTHRADEVFPTITEYNSGISIKEKTEIATTESTNQEITTDYSETTETESTVAPDLVTKSKVAKVLKTSTTTKISHETEICYKGKCIRTKSENPDEDLKLLVDSASTMKIEKSKT